MKDMKEVSFEEKFKPLFDVREVLEDFSKNPERFGCTVDEGFKPLFTHFMEMTVLTLDVGIDKIYGE